MILLAGWVLITLLIHIPSWSPITRDEGVFLFAGQQLADGALLYRDVWDHKPPAIHVVNALAAQAGGRWAAWVLVGVVLLSCVLLSARVLLDAFGPRAGAVAAVAHALLVTNPRLFQENGNTTELYGLGLQWTALFLVSRGGGSAARLATATNLCLAGIVAGAAFSFKPTTVAIAFGITVVLLATRDWRGGLAWLLGLSVVPLLLVLWLAALGVLPEAVDRVWTFNHAYATADPLASLVATLRKLITMEPLNLLSPLVVVSLLVRPAPSKAAANLVRITALALPIDVLAIAAQGRSYGHYFLTVLPLVVVRLGLLCAYIGDRFPQAARRARFGTTILLLVCLVQWANHERKHLRARHEELVWQRGMVASIRNVAPSARTVFFWGAELAVNYRGGWATPSRFGYVFPLFTPGYVTLDVWAQLVDDLERRPPDVIVDASVRATAGWPYPIVALDQLVDAPMVPVAAQFRLHGFLEQYRVEGGDGLIRVRRASSSAPG